MDKVAVENYNGNQKQNTDVPVIEEESDKIFFSKKKKRHKKNYEKGKNNHQIKNDKNSFKFHAYLL
jgi:hypothetical protein